MKIQDYDSKDEKLRQFSTSESDHEIMRNIIERKQQLGKTFDGFYADVKQLTIQLQNKMQERN